MQAKLSSTARLIDLLLKICGSTEQAAKAIGSSTEQLHNWQRDTGAPDALVFERIVDVIIDFQQRQIADQDKALRELRERMMSKKPE